MGNILKKYNLTKAQWEVVGGAITGDTLPIGAIIPFGGTEAPTGWLICDGSMLNRETYKELFAAIGTNFGTDGPGNFYIPDLRGKVAVGQDTTDSDFGMGAVGGSKYIQDHQHLGIKWAGPNGQNINMNAGTGGVQIEPNSWQGGDGTRSPIFSGKVYETPTGNSGNLQPYQVTNYIIKAFQSSGVVAQVSNTKSDSTTDTYSCNYINNIIEMGTNDNGRYEKYANGMLKCYYTQTISTDIKNSWGSLVISPTIQLQDYPITFKAITSLNMSVVGTTASAWIINAGDYNLHRPCPIQLCAGNSINQPNYFRISVCAIGTWK